MDAEESLNKSIYRIGLFLLKILPMLMAALFLLNTILSYFNIDCSFISYVAGIGILPLLFFYVASYMFKFCKYHRMFLHYIVVNNIICFIDYNYTIPISNRSYLLLHIIIAGLFLFIILYLKKKHERLFKEDYCKAPQGNCK